MHEGHFGVNELPNETSLQKTLAMRLLRRELGLGDEEERNRLRSVIPQGLIPVTKPEMIINFDACVFSGQFSDDGNFFYACGKDFKVRMYDTSNPHAWRHYKTVSYPGGQWTLTDGSLSRDNRWLAYTSISSIVCLAPTNPDDHGEPYTMNLRRGTRMPDYGIWSVRFSGDGRELVAGTNAKCVVVYDIESRTVINEIRGHHDDVNAVCFADSSSPFVFYSGSDDTVVKVWDRRDLHTNREAGVFIGHIEGITYLDSKDDGRYLLSNGKDQSMRLWDCRKMMSSSTFRELRIEREPTFDYRWGNFREANWYRDKNDNSVVTFRGHKVLRTLIRCHFSPPNSTNSRYVYSGSQDGKVWIWDMNAEVKQVVDVQKATAVMRQGVTSTRLRNWGLGAGDPGETVVRDASWHPNAPMLVGKFPNMAKQTPVTGVAR
jgi:DDB1- and CUL4-associated factor 11